MKTSVITRIRSASRVFWDELTQKERANKPDKKALAIRIAAVMDVAGRSNFLADLRRMHEFNGIYSQVARELGCTPQHVRQVAVLGRTGPRVLTALEKRYREIEKKIGQQNGGTE